MLFTSRLLEIIEKIDENTKEERAAELERLTNKQRDFFHYQKSNFDGSSLKNFADVKTNKEAYEKYLKTRKTLKAHFNKLNDRLNEINKNFENQNEAILKEKEEIEQNLKMIKEAIEECDAFIKKYELKEGKAKNLLMTFECQDFSVKPIKKALESMISLINQEIERKQLQIVKFENVNVNKLDKDIEEKKIISSNIIEKTEELNRKLGLLEVFKKALQHHLKEALTKEELETMVNKFVSMYEKSEDITLKLAQKQEENKEIEEAEEEELKVKTDFDTSKLAEKEPKNFNIDNGLKTESINPNFVDADDAKKKMELQKLAALLGSYINTENSQPKDELDLEEIKSRLEELKYYIEGQSNNMDEIKEYFNKIGCSLKEVEQGVKVMPAKRNMTEEEVEEYLNKIGCTSKKDGSEIPEFPITTVPLVSEPKKYGKTGYKVKTTVVNSGKPATSGVGDTIQDVEEYLAKMGCRLKEDTKNNCLLAKKEVNKQANKQVKKQVENEPNKENIDKQYDEFVLLLNNVLNGFEQLTDEKEKELNEMYENLSDDKKKLHSGEMSKIQVYLENQAHDEMKLDFVPAKRGFFERIGALTFKGGSKLSIKSTAKKMTNVLDRADEVAEDKEMLDFLEKKYDKLGYKLAKKAIINTSKLSVYKNRLEKKKYKLYNNELRNYKTITKLADKIEKEMWKKLRFELSLVNDNYGEAFVSTVIEQYLYLISISNNYKKHVTILNEYLKYASQVLEEKDIKAIREMLKLIYNYRSNKKDAIFEFDRKEYLEFVENYSNENVQKILK